MFESSKFTQAVRIYFVLIIVASISDIIVDINNGAFILHVFQEMLIGLAALIFSMIIFINARLQIKRNDALESELNEIKIKSAKASQKLVDAKRRFSEEMVKQFSDWSFTASETEIATLTLKGLSAKEIANLRSSSEKTVRNQLTSIYKKSGTGGKVSFISWFMEGLA